MVYIYRKMPPEGGGLLKFDAFEREKWVKRSPHFWWKRNEQVSSEFGFRGWSVAACPSSRCPCISWGMPTLLNHLVLESIVRVLKYHWQHEWVQMVVQHTHVPSRLTKGLCQSSNSQQQIGIYLSQVVFNLLITSYAAALGEWSICLILGVVWGGCVVFSIIVWYYRFLKIVLQWKT